MKKQALLQVLRDARVLLAQPDNNFDWSSWKDAEAALREVDALIERVSTDATLERTELTILFAPTGPIQEVSVSSGWGNAFLKLAEQFDDAMRY